VFRKISDTSAKPFLPCVIALPVFKLAYHSFRCCNMSLSVCSVFL